MIGNPGQRCHGTPAQMAPPALAQCMAAGRIPYIESAELAPAMGRIQSMFAVASAPS